MKRIHCIEEALGFIKNGKIIAYPTEAVYGLGCDPFNQRAVAHLLAIKQRSQEKGLILLISDWLQLTPLIDARSELPWEAIKQSWPGPVTWLFPKSLSIPHWLSGEHASIAVRMTAHPVARQLCDLDPLVSTSANISGCVPARSENDLRLQFPKGVEGVVAGALGHDDCPSTIVDALTGQRLR